MNEKKLGSSIKYSLKYIEDVWTEEDNNKIEDNSPNFCLKLKMMQICVIVPPHFHQVTIILLNYNYNSTSVHHQYLKAKWKGLIIIKN